MKTRAVNSVLSLVGSLLAITWCMPELICAATSSDAYYTEEHVYGSRPNPDSEMAFGNIGVTGLKVRVYKGVVLKVEGTVPLTPADGKFKVGQIIAGINGEALKGKNPFVMLGNALTTAEAKDGKMIFDVQDSADTPAKKVTVIIPVLGAYGKTWPLKCGKSAKIIKQAAEYYAFNKEFKQHLDGKGIGGALSCLFLLSTGDNKYIPHVKSYFSQFLPDVKQIGDNTWNNGYNGIACGEYYLRTGDKSVLPILQYYCDDAQLRQRFNCSWTHWGRGIAPGYVVGGLMNPAGAQVLTTLLMAKECGVNVDEKTLLGALRFWYRFAGHGTVPYGDHRPEGGFGSNGKDGMSAAAMQIASGAQGNVSIYTKARNYLAMSTLHSYPDLVQGHADDGRGDGIWRGVVTAYNTDKKPLEYYAAMQRLQWWYDLSRRPSGGLGMATCQSFDDEGSGAGVALSYTAPLKTLRITGAPRSKYAKNFKLPEHLWGRQADQAFLSDENSPAFKKYGESEPSHIPNWKFGSGYHSPKADLKSVPRKEMLKNVCHWNYMIRVQAAKALRKVGAFDELEKLLQDADPRVRRAALDGMIDYNYWFSMGGETIKTEELTPAMLAAITKILSNPQEALWVVDGALMAMKLAPAKEINNRLPLILPWTKHEDWWLRESAFTALQGLEKDDELFLKIVPTLVNMLVDEYHTMPRGRFTEYLQGAMQRKKIDSAAGKLIFAGFKRAVNDSEIKPGDGSSEGIWNIVLAVNVCLGQAPETAIMIAKTMKTRFSLLDAGQIAALVATPNSNPGGDPFGLYGALKKLPPAQRQELTDILYNEYRPEFVRRMKAEAGNNQVIIDTVLDLTKLKNPSIGWQAVGKPRPTERIWRYTAFTPLPAERLPERERRRFRDVTLPAGFKNWQKPGFDDSKWNAGKAPIGVGLYQQGGASFTNHSAWGDGEFLLMRTTFEVDVLDADLYRLSILANQGYHIYLNGHDIQSYGWWQDRPFYAPCLFGVNETRGLKKGTNVLAVYCNVEYREGKPQGQIDVYLESLKKKDLE